MHDTRQARLCLAVWVSVSRARRARQPAGPGEAADGPRGDRQGHPGGHSLAAPSGGGSRMCSARGGIIRSCRDAASCVVEQMSSLLSVLPRRSAGSATSSSEDEDEDGDQSPRPVQGMATRVSDDGAAMDDDTAWPITSLVELGLVHGFKRALASRSDLGEEEKQAYPRLVQSVVQKVAQRARLDRIKSLQKVDIRPFYEDNKQAFEDLWRRAGGQRLRCVEHPPPSAVR